MQVAVVAVDLSRNSGEEEIQAGIEASLSKGLTWLHCTNLKELTVLIITCVILAVGKDVNQRTALWHPN